MGQVDDMQKIMNMSNKDAAVLLSTLSSSLSHRGNGKSRLVLMYQIAILKAIAALNSTPD